MARVAKMIDVEVFGRMAKMKVVVRKPATESTLKRTIAEAMRFTYEAEFNTQTRSKYRNALNN
jgi:hypothetical protein